MIGEHYQELEDMDVYAFLMVNIIVQMKLAPAPLAWYYHLRAVAKEVVGVEDTSGR
jgi:hypothetical protein